MRPYKRLLVTGCTAITAGWSVFTGLGAGYDLPDQDAFVIGRGMAFVATADNPSAIYYNPAGLTQLPGNNVRLGVYALDLGTTYEPLPPASGEFHNQKKFHAVPQLYYSYGQQEGPWSFGLGLYSPYGLGAQWPQDTGFRTLGIESSLVYFTVNPVVAYRILPSLSVAAGVTANYAQLDLQQGLLWPAQGFDNLRFKGDGWDVGYNLGVRFQPLEKLAFGVTFRSSTSVDLQGHTTYYNYVPFPPGIGLVPAFPKQEVSADATLPFPFKIISGVSYRPTTNWNFEFNADYTHWDAVDTVIFHQAYGFPPLLPKDIPAIFDWKSSWYFEFGGTRYLGNGWRVSAGYILNQSCEPDAHYTPLVADVQRHFFSAGVGYRGKRYDFDVAYQFGYGPSHTVTGSAPSAIGQTADGEYSFISHALAVSVGLHF